MAIPLISAQEIINRAIVEDNFEDALLKDEYIKSAEWDDLKPVLGLDFYTDVVNNRNNYEALMPYIKNCLAFWTLAKCLPFIHYKIVSNGLNINFTDYGRPVTNDDKAKLHESVIGMAEDYKEIMEVFIENNIADYPLYDNGLSGTKRVGGILI